MNLPPIKLRRLYTNIAGQGVFIIRAEDLPEDIFSRMTGAERMARQDAERTAVEAEWKKLNKKDA
jgi:hypothetical protein